MNLGTQNQEQNSKDTFLEVDFLDSDSYQDYPILLYSRREDTFYDKNNFLFPDTHYEKYNSLLDEKIEDRRFYLNENDLDYSDDDEVLLPLRKRPPINCMQRDGQEIPIDCRF
jgi:hypothetical protein